MPPGEGKVREASTAAAGGGGIRGAEASGKEEEEKEAGGGGAKGVGEGAGQEADSGLFASLDTSMAENGWAGDTFRWNSFYKL